MTKNELVASGILEQYVLGLCTKEEEELVERMAAEDKELNLLLQEMKGTVSHCCSKRLGKHEAKHRLMPKMPAKGDHLKLAHTLRQKNFWNTAGPLVAILAGVVLVFAIIQMREKSALQESLIAETNQSRDPLMTETSPAVSLLLDDDSTKYISFDTHKKDLHGFAMLIWNDPLNRAMLNIMHLPPLSDNLQYHIWCNDTSGKTHHVGRFPAQNDYWMDLPYDLKMLEFRLSIDAAHDNVTIPEGDQIVATARIN